jgi:hypothetical protein
MDEPKNLPKWQQQRGHPVGSFLIYKTKGIWKNQEEIDNNVHLSGTMPGDIRYVDINEDGKISGDDKVRDFKSNIPKIQYGISGTIHYKNIGFSFLFQGQALAKASLDFSDYHGFRVLFKNRWTPQHTNAPLPRAFLRDDAHNQSNDRPSEFWLFDASFIRFKSAMLSYSIPKALLTNIGISNIMIYAKGRNLITWDRMIGNFDPEKENSINPYPKLTKALIGINITF